MSKWVPGADWINGNEKEEAQPRLADDQIFGVPPTIKRKRSFWRAYRRKEFWAIMSYATKAMMIDIECQLYGIPIENIKVDKYVPNEVIYIIRKNNE